MNTSTICATDFYKFYLKEQLKEQNILLILRGLPGSGKSTFAKKVQSLARKDKWRAVICSTDNWNEFVNGDYLFERETLGWFHELNDNVAEICMVRGCNLVIIDNTNIKRKDFASYIYSARAEGFLCLERLIGGYSEDDVELYAERNTHGVPIKTIKRMAESLRNQKTI